MTPMAWFGSEKGFYLEDLDDAYFLDLGLVDDMDFTYINGVFVGACISSRELSRKAGTQYLLKF